MIHCFKCLNVLDCETSQCEVCQIELGHAPNNVIPTARRQAVEGVAAVVFSHPEAHLFPWAMQGEVLAEAIDNMVGALIDARAPSLALSAK